MSILTEREFLPIGKSRDLTGQKFGRLTAIGIVERRVYFDGGSKPFWLCRCECGGESVVCDAKLVSGHTKSCGCIKRENIAERNRGFKCGSHYQGAKSLKLLAVWRGIKNRCTSKNSSEFPRYGGRGISVCDEWLVYKAFEEWALSNGYKEGLSIDRIQNDSGYSPDNCRWATAKEQANNRSTTVTLAAFGESKSLAEWARDDRCNVSYGTLRRRLFSEGMPAEEAITDPLKRQAHPRAS
jgi:hypothetical protein